MSRSRPRRAIRRFAARCSGGRASRCLPRVRSLDVRERQMGWVSPRGPPGARPTRRHTPSCLTPSSTTAAAGSSCGEDSTRMDRDSRHDNRTVPSKISGRCLVTGAAGFIGSHLADRLVADGCEVVGVDSFTDYYDPALKERNVEALRASPRFTLVRADLAADDLESVVAGIDYIFHQSGQPGVRRSWGRSFEPYVRCNVIATQRLLEAARTVAGLRRFVNASSSSIYGNATELPVTEQALPKPVSPYGVTKLAAEHLATLYADLGVPAVSLRYFTVYGPRQRPDMAFNVFLRALLGGRDIDVNGDGEQTRDFTFVADAVG